MREKAAGQHVNLLAGVQLLGGTHGIAGGGVVITHDQLQLFAAHSACGVDLLYGQLHAFFVGFQKRGLGLVAVDFPDLDDPLGPHGHGGQCQSGSHCAKT